MEGFDQLYYNPIVNWIQNERTTYPNGGKYPVKKIASDKTRDKFIWHVKQYELQRRECAKRGINEFAEVTFSDDYNYLIIHGTRKQEMI